MSNRESDADLSNFEQELENMFRENGNNNLGNNVNYGTNVNSNSNANNNRPVRLAKGASNQNYNKKETIQKNLREILKGKITNKQNVENAVNKLYALKNVTANKIRKAVGVRFKKENIAGIISIIGRRKSFKSSNNYNKISNMTRGKIPLNKQAFINFYKENGESIYNKTRLMHMRNGLIPMNRNAFINLYKKTNGRGNADLMYNRARYNLMKKFKMKPERQVFENIAYQKYRSFPKLSNMEEMLLTENEKRNRIPDFLGQLTKEYNVLSKKYNKLIAAARRPQPVNQTGPFRRPVETRRRVPILEERPEPVVREPIPRNLLTKAMIILYPSRSYLMNNNLNYRVGNTKKNENIQVIMNLNAALSTKNKTIMKSLRAKKIKLKDITRHIRNYLRTNSLHSYFNKRLVENYTKLKNINRGKKGIYKLAIITQRNLGRLPKNINVNREANKQLNENIRDLWSKKEYTDMNRIIEQVSDIIYPTKVMLARRPVKIDKSPKTLRILRLFLTLSEVPIFKTAFSKYLRPYKLQDKKLFQVVKDVKDYLRISTYNSRSLTTKQKLDISRVLNGRFLNNSNKRTLENMIQNMLMSATAPQPEFFKNKAEYNRLKKQFNSLHIKQMEQMKIFSDDPKTKKFMLSKLKNYLPKSNKPNIGKTSAEIIKRPSNKNNKNLPKRPVNYKPKAQNKKQTITFKKAQRNEKMNLVIEALRRLQLKEKNNKGNYLNLPESQASVIAYRVIKSSNPRDNLESNLIIKNVKYTQNNVNSIMRILEKQEKPDVNKNLETFLNSVNFRTTTPRNVIRHMTNKGHSENKVKESLGRVIELRRRGTGVPTNKENALKKGYTEQAWQKAQRALRGQINVVQM